MLKIIGNRTTDDAKNVGGGGLRQINGNVYIPLFLRTPLSYLKEGCMIWIKQNDGNYKVYELEQSVSEDELLLFISENIT